MKRRFFCIFAAALLMITFTLPCFAEIPPDQSAARHYEWYGDEWSLPSMFLDPSRVTATCTVCRGGVNELDLHAGFWESDTMCGKLQFATVPNVPDVPHGISGVYGSGASGFVIHNDLIKAEPYFLRFYAEYGVRPIIRCFDRNGMQLTSAEMSLMRLPYNSYYGGWYNDCSAGQTVIELLFPEKVDTFQIGFCWTDGTGRYDISYISLSHANVPFRYFGDLGDTLFFEYSSSDVVQCPTCSADIHLEKIGDVCVAAPLEEFNFWYDVINGAYQSIYNGAYTNGHSSGYTEGYGVGYDKAESDCAATHQGIHDEGYAEGYDVATDDCVATHQEMIDGAYTEGHSTGYKKGFVEGEQSEVSENFIDMIGEIAAAPYNAIVTMFDFEIFGINIAGLVFKVFTVFVVLIVGSIVFKYIF